MIKDIHSYDEFKEIISTDKIVVIDCWANWCGPCRMISPIFDALAGRYTAIGAYKVNVDEQMEVGDEIGVRAMPTFVAYQNGSKLAELVGASPPALYDMFQKLGSA
ncbi:thioredoxin-like protein [Schizophyllum commune]